MRTRNKSVLERILKSLCALFCVIAIQAHGATTFVNLVDDGISNGDSVAGDGIVDFAISGLPNGVSIAGELTTGFRTLLIGSRPGSREEVERFYINMNSLSVMNDSAETIDYRLRFVGPEIQVLANNLTATNLHGQYVDTPGDGDGLANLLDLRGIGSIDFGEAISIADLPEANSILSSTWFGATGVATNPVAFPHLAHLIAELDFVVAPGSGFELSTFSVIAAPLPPVAFLFPLGLVPLVARMRRKVV